MAKYSIEDSTLVGIADAIRAKEGTADAIPVSNFASRVAALPEGGASIETCTVIINGNASGTSNALNYITASTFVDSVVVPYAYYFLQDGTLYMATIENVICGSCISVSVGSYSIPGNIVDGGVTYIKPLGGGYAFQAPTEPGSTGTITFYEKD